MKLSDAFMADCDTISIEVVVRFINVNYEKGAALLGQCRTMQEYSMLIHMIRVKYSESGDLGTAIEESIRECQSKGVLTEFLKEHGGDVMSFLFEKLTREECEAIREADGYSAGFEQGEAAGFEKGEATGIEKVMLKIAATMKNAGEPLNKIISYTGLSEDELEKL